ncbi:MAG TPA: FtsW/RodA/SpoVE family cell cycle protein [Chthoniobacterales bacterium]|jgi:hypothetical protein|nr:FtsW/RodA/SpoVE family cell cycle protein [Chthoniobacterales bacterium]
MRLALVFLPLFLYLLRPRIVRLAPMAMAAAASAASLILILTVVWFSPVWPEAYRLTWLGVSAKADNRLVIGGPSENSVCGWPNEALSPAVGIVAQSPNTGIISVEGGGGFVFVRDADGIAQWEPINGEVIKPGEDKIFEDSFRRCQYVFQVRPDGLWLSSVRFRLTIYLEGAERRLLAEVPLRSAGNEGNVTGLAPLLELRTARLGGTLEERIALRTWAGAIRIFVPRSRTGTVRVAGPSAVTTASIPLPAQIFVRWAGNSPVKGSLRFSDGRLKCDFLKPWRWTSPLPPRIGNAYPRIQICAQPQPKDHAFLLPLGRATGALRVERELRPDDSGKLSLLEPKAAPETTYIPPQYFARRATWTNEESVLSKTELDAGDYQFAVGVTYDLPSFLRLVACCLPAFVIFLLALSLVNARMEIVKESREAAFGLALSLWVFLCVRLLLALRYALETAHLDQIAVEGVTGAYLALAAIPSLILLFARIAFLNVQPMPDDRGPRVRVFVFCGAWLGTLGLTWLVARNLWPSWPATGGRFLWAIALASGLGAIICAMLDYNTYSERHGGLRRILVGWSRPVASHLIRLWARIFQEGKGVATLQLVMIALMTVVSAIGFLLTFGGAREASEEIIIPLACIWLPVLFWLTGQAGAAIDRTRAGPSGLTLFWLVLLFAVAPIAAQVGLSGDAGTAFAAFAAFFSLACLLWLMRPRRFGWALLGTLVMLFGALLLAAFNAPALFDKLGEAGVRIRSFVRPDEMQIQYLFGRGIPADEDSSGLKADKILNVRQHTWENFALAHEGGVFGMGFGEAPVRRSHVPLQTVQCDSVFSFYILSEHGLAGGMALLFGSLVPLLCTIRAARLRLDVGFGLALVITSAFVIEMLTQAAMNLGLLPFTGRNLPFLAVLSPTDLTKWTILFAVATRALFLSYDRDGSRHPNASPLFAPTSEPAITPRVPLFVTAGIPIALVVIIAAVNGKHIADKNLDKPFTWEKLGHQVRELQNRGYVTVDPVTHALGFNEAPENEPWLPLDNSRLLEQEIVRFNQLPEEERYREGGLQDFRRRLQGVSNTLDYDSLMNEWRQKSSVRLLQPRPPVFEIRFVPDPRDEQERQLVRSHKVPGFKDGESGGWEVRANGDFNSQLNFKRPLLQAQLPQVQWEGNQRTGLLLGPAWVMGKDIIAYDPAAPLPWVTQLADALRQQREEFRSDAKGIERLTISPHIHQAALEFVTRQGRDHHANLLAAAARRKSSDAGEIRERIPPRLALSVLNLSPAKRGEVVALAGWPRTTSRRFWERSNDGEWRPPAQWLEKNVPESIKRRYLGDRNFDLLLMGSASKPILAAAAIATQPELDKQLHTLGGDKDVRELFGAEIPGPPWDESWHGGVGPWRNFENYLAQSDNRYHIRLGFLALAERNRGTVAKTGTAPSGVVSLDASPAHHPWSSFPKFPEAIAFRQDSTTRMEKLDETGFATQLKAFFPIGITTGELRRTRLSFWTRNEENDVSPPGNAEGSDASPFREISPQPPHLDLDRIATPREYIAFLLGGMSNMWSNVDFAGAFGTAVLGRPIVPHIVAGERLPVSHRTEFLPVAERLRPGLRGVIKFGTASKRFAAGPKNLLDRWAARGYDLYAKTGTLEEDDTSKLKTSRLVVALLRWDKKKTDVQNGLVFSLVTEHAATGTATAWLAEFIANNDAQIKEFLDRVD